MLHIIRVSFAGNTRTVTAFYDDFILLQFSAFPLVLAVAAAPDVNVGLVMQARNLQYCSKTSNTVVFRVACLLIFTPSLIVQTAPQLLAVLEPLRAAAEAM